MSNNNNLYRGYLQWKDTAQAQNGGDVTALGSIDSDSNYKNSFITLYDANIEIFTDWIETFERYMPYVEKCVGQSRSFLSKNDEVLPIEQARNINIKDSLMHLVKNSSDILKIEQNGEIIPSRVVNTRYKNDYTVYENLFLFSIVQRCDEYLYKCYQMIEQTLNKKRMRINLDEQMSNTANDTQCKMEFFVEYDAEASNKVKITDQEIENLNRLLVLRAKVDNLQNSKIIANLQGTKPISGQLNKTNVLTKNKDFVVCVEFWEYLTALEGETFDVVKTPSQKKMTKKQQASMREMIEHMQFMVKMYFDKDFRQYLESNHKVYQREKRRDEKKQKLTQQLQEARRIEEVMLGQKVKDYEDFNNLMLGKISKVDPDVDKLSQPIGQLLERYEDIAKSAKTTQSAILDDMVRELEEQMDEAIEVHQEALNPDSVQSTKNKQRLQEIIGIVQHKNQEFLQQQDQQSREQLLDMLTELRDEHQQSKLEYQQQIEQMVEVGNRQVEDIRATAQVALDKAHAMHNSDIQKLGREYQDKLEQLQAEHESYIEQQRQQFLASIAKVQADCLLRISNMQKAHAKAEANMQANFDRQLAMANKRHSGLLQREKANNIANVARLNKKLQSSQKGYKAKAHTLLQRLTARIAKAQIHYQRNLDRYKKTTAGEISQLVAQHNAQMQQLRTQCNSDMKALHADHSQQLLQQQQQSEQQQQLQQSQYIALEQQFATLNDANARLQEELSLQQANSQHIADIKSSYSIKAIDSDIDTANSDTTLESQRILQAEVTVLKLLLTQPNVSFAELVQHTNDKLLTQRIVKKLAQEGVVKYKNIH